MGPEIINKEKSLSSRDSFAFTTRIYRMTIFIFILLLNSLSGQNKPSPATDSSGNLNGPTRSVLFDQMDNAGTNSITSQNFEPANDIYDSFAADDFAFLDDTWFISSIEVAGVYYNGTGPASSVNIWIYSSNGFGGLPQDIIYSALNVVPSAGLADGSFTIDIPDSLILTEGWYWLCVQANIDFSSGQWGWTGRTVQSFSESAWMNPGGGFATSCTPSWGYRVTDCGVGNEPDNCFRINGDIIPVELISFTATATGQEVRLRWTTATETNNKGFEIERSQKSGVRIQNWTEIVFIEGYGTSSEVHNYNFTDKNLMTGKYSYRLKQIDFDGSYKYSEVVGTEVTVPLSFNLEQNYPNPFNPTTVIVYSIPVKSFVNLEIFNALGQKVKSLVNEEKGAGSYKVEFSAEILPSGIYLYRLSADGNSDTRKMLLVK